MSDAIILVGLSGSGKTAVGARLAARLGRPFLDIDREIASSQGTTVAQIIDRRGEDVFRELEKEAVARACQTQGAVVATGGGAVIDPLNRWDLWRAGVVAWLDAPDATLTERLQHHPEVRPLLADGPGERLAAQRTSRARFYRAADVRIEADGSIDGVTDRVAVAVEAGRPEARRLLDEEVRRDHRMGPPTARVVLGDHLSRTTFAEVLGPVTTGEPIVVADRRAAGALTGLMAALPGGRRIHVGSGERQKRLRSVDRLLETASALGVERGDAWVAVGGGVTTDLVGTAAALYLRGAQFVAVPTTWLGMTDAAIGGKVAVDLSRAKNAAGAFWPPVAIVGDVASLDTLPRSRRLDGMAESLKSGLIGDPVLWRLVETRGRAALRDDVAARYAIIDRSVRLKLDIVDRDPFEKGERRTLNLGHTLGHALEVESGYRLAHGQAVVLGLRAVAHIANGRGADTGLSEHIDEVVSGLGFALTREFDVQVVKHALGSDKKRTQGRQHWILPMRVGVVVDVDDVTERELDAAIAHIRGGRR